MGKYCYIDVLPFSFHLNTLEQKKKCEIKYLPITKVLKSFLNPSVSHIKGRHWKLMFDFYFNLKIPLNFSDKVVDKHFFTQLATFPFTVEVCKRREVHVKSVRKAKMQPKIFSVGTEVSACGVQLCI